MDTNHKVMHLAERNSELTASLSMTAAVEQLKKHLGAMWLQWSEESQERSQFSMMLDSPRMSDSWENSQKAFYVCVCILAK